MVENPLTTILQEQSRPLVGASTLTHAPEILDVYGGLDLDFVWIDHEHIGAATGDGNHFQRIRKFCTSAGIEPIVRVSSPVDPVVGKILDAGIRTLVLPDVESPSQLRETLRSCYFNYDGEQGDRGLGTSFASNWGTHPEDYTEQEDAAVLVGIMIETETAITNLDALLSVPQVGFVQVGPTDLSASFGVPLERDHSAVQEAIQDVLDAGQRHGVPVGASTGYIGGVEVTIDRGFGLVKIGNEITATREILGERMERFREIDPLA